MRGCAAIPADEVALFKLKNAALHYTGASLVMSSSVPNDAELREAAIAYAEAVDAAAAARLTKRDALRKVIKRARKKFDR